MGRGTPRPREIDDLDDVMPTGTLPTTPRPAPIWVRGLAPQDRRREDMDSAKEIKTAAKAA
jgi:hypothetical protein